MPFWIKLIGSRDHNLFHLRTNLRYGCVDPAPLPRHRERRSTSARSAATTAASARPHYPNLVLAAWLGNWNYPVRTPSTAPPARSHSASKPCGRAGGSGGLVC